ncbi:MAG TPA: methyltransferase domain-containing protein [Ktedonobacterales bacterium]|nr:methyltransferase domain-containing protein [Ktedonobacterales bacterium]
MGSNTGQAASTNTWDAALYDGKHSFVWKYGASLLELLAPQPGERVLDVGCGTGHLTAQIAAAGAEVVGIDKSADMLEEARKRYPALRFELADAADVAFDAPFDAVFSNAALHWMTEPERVAANIARALKPGGRFVAEFGGKGNMQALIVAVVEALEAMGYSSEGVASFWYFPGIGEYAALLERQGLEVTSALLFDRPTSLEGGDEGLRVWLKMFGTSFLAALSAEQQAELVRRVEERLRPTQYRDGTWIAPYRRLRVVATKA